MASQPITETEDEVELNSCISQSKNNSALQHRRHLRKRSTSTVGGNADSSPTSVTTTETKSSDHYFLHPERPPSRRQRSLSSNFTIPTGHNTVIHLDNFLAQSSVVTRRINSSEEFLHNETITRSSTAIVAASKESSCYKPSSVIQPSMDIDVHVVYGASSVINQINLNKQKLMAARKPLPKIQSRRSAITSADCSQNDQPKKLKSQKQNKRIKRSTIKLKTRDTKPSRGIVQKTSKPNEVPKKRISRATRKKTVPNVLLTSSYTQTDSGVMQPCRSFIENKKCPIQSICPYLHSEFPCKYYYLGFECPHDNNCQFMHNSPLSETQKDALRSHILDLLSTPSVYDLSDSDCSKFVQQMRDKDDLWDYLQICEHKLKTESQTRNKILDDESIIEAKGDLDFLTPQQVKACNALSSKEMETQMHFLSRKQLEYLKSNHNIENRDELMQLTLGRLHEIGIIQLPEESATMHETSDVNDVAEQQIVLQDNDNIGETVMTEVIEVDDDDEYDGDHVLVIDETYTEPNGNILPLSNEPSSSEHQMVKSPQESEQTQAFESHDKVDDCYWKLKEANHVVNSIEERLRLLKTKTIPNKEKVSQLMAIYETLTRQEKLIEQSSISNVQATTGKMTINENMVSALPAVLCEVVPNDANGEEKKNCIFLVAEGEDKNNNSKTLETTTEDQNLKPSSEISVISDEILKPNEYFLFNSNDIDSVEVSNTNVVGISAIEDNRQENGEKEMSDTNTHSGELTTGADQIVTSQEAEKDIEMRTVGAMSEDTSIVNDYEGTVVQAPALQHELCAEEEVITDRISVTKMTEDNCEDSPPYENITSSVENTPKSSVPKYLLSDDSSSTARPRLRSDSLQQTEDISSNTSNSQESDVAPTKAYKPRRLKIPKPRDINMEKSPKSGQLKQRKHSRRVSEEWLEELPKQIIILSNRYSKKFKAKQQQQQKMIETDVVKSRLQKTDNYTTDGSVESQMSALYGDSDEAIDSDNITTKSTCLAASQDPHITDDSMELFNNNDISAPEIAPGEQPHKKIIPVKKTTNQPTKTKRLKSRNITITKTVRRHVSFETPTTTSNASSGLTSDDIVSKCQRGKPYVLLTKLEPQYIKSLQKKQRNAYSSAVSHTTCNITNTTSSITSTTSLGSTCLCDGTSHVLGLKTSCFANLDEEKNNEGDNECVQAHHKHIRMDSMNILRENSMECETSDGSTMAHRITYKNNVVFEDISTTDYYSSSDEKASVQNALQSSSSSSKISTTSHEKKHQEQLQMESDLRQEIENISNKSDLQLLQTQQEIQKIKICREATPTRGTSGKTDDSQERLQNENSVMLSACAKVFADIKQEDGEQHSMKAVDEDEKPVDLPSATTKSNKKLSYVLLRSAENGADVSNIHLSSAKGVVVEYPSDVVQNDSSNAKNKDESVEYYKYTSLANKLSEPHMAKCRLNFDKACVNITPISSPTYACDGIASPSPVKDGGGLLVAAVDYHLGGEIDGRLTIPNRPYILWEIDLPGIDVNKPKNIGMLLKTASLDPRIFRSNTKRIAAVIQQPQQTSTHYQTFTNPPVASTTFYPSVSPNDPRNRSHTIVQQSPQPHAQNALVSYNANALTTVPLPPSSPAVGVLQNFTPSAFAQTSHQQTPNMILYDCIQTSTWYHSLPSSSKMQVNQSVTHLVTALNGFQRERRLNPAALFNIFKLDNAIELLDNMNNLGIFVDENGVINKRPHTPSYDGRPCTPHGPIPTCNATYSFIQQVLAPAAQCTSLPRSTAAVAGTCNTPNEQFVSCYVEQPKAAATMPCCAHKHQQEDMSHRQEQQPPFDDNYNDNRRNNQFRKPFNNQRFHNNNNNNSRYFKPSSSYGGGGGDSHSPTRSSSPPQSQSFFPRGGGGGFRYNNNRRPQTSGDGSPPPLSPKPFNNNRKFNRNNFNKNSNYGNNNSSPAKSTSSGGYQNSSPPPPPPPRRTPPPLSPRPDKEQSPVLNSPARQQQKHPPSADEECWD